MNTFKDVKESVVRLAKLYIEDTKLSIVESLTMFLGGLILATFGVLCIILFLVFVSFGVAEELRAFLTPGLAYFAVAMFWIIVFGLAIIFRQKIVYDVIVRFISKLILKNTNKSTDETEEEAYDEEE